MTDRELLEKAAKANGLVSVRWSKRLGLLHGIGYGEEWDSLNDVADAAKMAIHLRFAVNVCANSVTVTREGVNCHPSTMVAYDGAENAEMAYCRAVTVAAAAIGEAMP
jgi:hypothetical protein